MYWVDWLLAFLLLNTSNLFIQKQMFDKAAILARFGCFMCHLWPYLIRINETNGVEGAEIFVIEDASIGNISTRAVSE